MCEFNFFLNFNLNWIDWSGTDKLIIHSNIFSLLILHRFSWSQHPLFSKRFLVNLSLHSGIFPSDFKIARITPIYKGKGDKVDLSN